MYIPAHVKGDRACAPGQRCHVNSTNWTQEHALFTKKRTQYQRAFACVCNQNA